jgi:SH3-like domain-containing protein
MKLRLSIVAACLLAGLVAGCSYVLDSAGRATPPVSTGLAITRPDRPPATPVAGASSSSLTPTGQTPYLEGQASEAPGYPAPTAAPEQAVAAIGYPGPDTPAEPPPATVVVPTVTRTPVPSATSAPPTATPDYREQPTSTPVATMATRTPAPTPSDPVERAMLAVVHLASPMGPQMSMSSEGLGVALPSGRIVAPLHVLHDATSGQLYSREGRAALQSYDATGHPYQSAGDATLQAWDAGLDVAVLAVEGTADLPAAAVGTSDAASLPAQSPLHLVLLTSGRLGTLRVMRTEVAGRHEDDGGPWIMAAANLSTGAVGGGVAFNAAGQVVGLLQPEGGLAPGQLVRIRPIDAIRPLLAADPVPQPLPTALPVTGEERVLRILYRGAEGVNLRSGPSTRASILASLHRDEVYPIVSPGESDGWYPIYTGQGRAGWVALRHPTGTRLTEPETIAFQSALAEGGEAEVACLSAVPGRGCVNLRATPGWRNKAQDDVLAELTPGHRLELLTGPRQVDGLAWWQVRDPENGMEGWVAEVTAGGYRALIVR